MRGSRGVDDRVEGSRGGDGGRGGGSAPAVAVPPQAECVVCMDAAPSHMLIPCGHVCVCAACAERCLETTRECPMCREPVREAFQAFNL